MIDSRPEVDKSDVKTKRAATTLGHCVQWGKSAYGGVEKGLVKDQ